MKNVGIVVDDYKLHKYRKALRKKGFDDFRVRGFTKNTSSIQINVDDDKVDVIHKLCKVLELGFKRSN